MLDSPQKVDYNFYKSPKKLDNEVFLKLLEREMSFRKFFFTVFIVLSVLTLCGCASLERDCKTIKSDISGGLDRIVVVYDMSGNEMARYEGQIDLATEDGCVQFEYEGKRIVWYNAIVSIIEK